MVDPHPILSELFVRWTGFNIPYEMDWENVVETVQRNPSIVHHKIQELTLLHFACSLKPPLVVVDVLLVANPKSVWEKDSHGNTPLMLACSKDASIEVIGRLLKGAAKKTIFGFDKVGRSVLYLARLSNTSSSQVVRKLLLTIDPTIANLEAGRKDRLAGSPTDVLVNQIRDRLTSKEAGKKLYYVLCARHYKTVFSRNGRQSFIHAALALNLERDALEIAFSQDGTFQAGTCDIYKHLPIHYAVKNGASMSSNLVPRLLEAFPHGAATPDPSGRLPLHVALENGFDWQNGIEALYQNHKAAINVKEGDEICPSSGLFPCAIAAAYSDLTTTFCLLKAHPMILLEAMPPPTTQKLTARRGRKRKAAATVPCVLHLALFSLLYLCGMTTSVYAKGILPDITSAIANTPLVDLSRICRQYGVKGRILGKCEYLSPGLSKKDRIAKQIIQDAIESGDLKPGQPVVELTSGNTGTGLAVVCSVLGFPFCAVMSKGNSVERARMMSALGAKVVLVDQAPGSTPGQVSGEDLNLVEEKARELVVEMSAFRADQFVRDGNMKAHYIGTGPELWDDSQGEVTAFCDFVGTGGTFGGVAAFLRPKGVRCYVVEPMNAAILAGKPVKDPNHRIQGGGYIRSAKDLPMLSSHEDTTVDGYVQVSDEEAIQATRDLAKYEGIFCGFSGGANFAAAVKLLKTTEKGGKKNDRHFALRLWFEIFINRFVGIKYV